MGLASRGLPGCSGSSGSVRDRCEGAGVAKVGYGRARVKDYLCASKKHLSSTIHKNPYQKPKVAEDVK